MKELYPKKYIPKKLAKKEKLKQKNEINKSRKLYKKGKYYRRKTIKNYKSKESPHIKKAKEIYDIFSLRPTKELSKKTGCTIDGLERIISKGKGAYYSSGSRVNQTPESWAYSRLASSITGGKSSVIDFNILKESCKKTSKALKYAKQAKNKHGKGTRKVPKIYI
jgi:hypothetical protein